MAEENHKSKKCIFENLLFENQCGRGFVEITDCEFEKCTFTGTLGKGKITVRNSIFSDCTFEKFHINSVDTSMISKCKFIECIVRNIDLTWSFVIRKTEITGGVIENLRIIDSLIKGNIFANLRMENIEMIGSCEENKMSYIVLKNITVTEEKKDFMQKNIFENCNTGEFIFIQDNVHVKIEEYR